MARENNAAVSRSCGWCWYRSVHCVRVNSHLILVRSLDIFSRCDRFIGLGPGGLGVIGGDTVNLVGLGGCKAEDYVSSDLPGYCARRVLQNPTVWLGIFMGGYA